MVVPKFLVTALVALNAVGIQAGPCKVSSSSTSELSSTPSQSTSGVSSTPQVTPTTTPSESETTPSVSSTTPGLSTTPEQTPTTTPTFTTSTTPTTTSQTPTATPTQNTCLYHERLKNPFPSDSLCGGNGYSYFDSSIYIGYTLGLFTLNECARLCHDTQGCTFFAYSPNNWCEMWTAHPQRTDDVLPWSWYDLSCFDVCDVNTLVTREEIIYGPAEGGEMPPSALTHA